MNDHGTFPSDVVVSSALFGDGFTPWEISIGLLLAKLTIAVGAALLLRALLIGRTSASVRHGILTAGLIALPLVTLFHFSSLAWNLPGVTIQAAGQAKIANATNVGDIAATESEPVIDRDPVDFPSTWTDTQVTQLGVNAATTEEVAVNTGELEQTITASCSTTSPPNAGADVPVIPNASVALQESVRHDDATQLESGEDSKKVASNSLFIWRAENRFFLYRVALAVWGLLSVLLLARIAFAWLAIKRQLETSVDLREHSIPLDQNNSKLLQSLYQKGVSIRVLQDSRNAPSAIGLIRPTILLPISCAQWTDVHWRSVLLHESAHLLRWDCWTNLLGRIIQAALWWHPLVTVLVRTVRIESEKACDDQVLRSGVNRADYADALLDFATCRSGRNLGIAAVGMVGIHPVESRISSILSHRDLRQPLKRTHLVALMFVAMSAALLLAALRVGIADRIEPVTIHQIDSLTNSALVQAGLPLTRPDADATPFDISNTEGHDVVSNLNWEFLIRNGGRDAIRTQGSFQVVIETDFGSVSVNSDSLLSLSASTDHKDRFLVRTIHGGEFVGKLASQFELASDKSDSSRLFLRNAGSSTSTEKTSESTTAIDPYQQHFSIRGIREARLVPGQITSGVSASGLSWHVRLPSQAANNPDQRWPTLVVLHQRDSNGLQYLRKIETVWPELAERYILVGIDGELRAEFDSDRNPRHSYSFINFAGKSDIYKGFPGTDRESPALVAETLVDLRKTLPTNQILLAGHHDGAIVALSVLMNFPETIDGAALLSGAMLIQNEPTAFTNEEIRSQQRERPVVLVHARSDASSSLAAWNALQNDSFERTKLIEIEEGEPGFTNLALDQAVEWLESNGS